MTAIRPTLADLVEAAEKGLDALRESMNPADTRKFNEIADALQEDLYNLRRLLSDVRCDLQANLDRM